MVLLHNETSPTISRNTQTSPKDYQQIPVERSHGTFLNSRHIWASMVLLAAVAASYAIIGISEIPYRQIGIYKPFLSSVHNKSVIPMNECLTISYIRIIYM